MSVLCFSRTINLRCAGLSRIENIILVIPPAIVFLASFLLAHQAIGHTKRKNSLIFIEAFAFFGLAVGDLALHLASNSANGTDPSSFLPTFALADRAIGTRLNL